jgi:hypothetical protein
VSAEETCPRTATVYGPRGTRAAMRCTGPTGHDGPHTYSFVSGQPGTFSVAVDEDGRTWFDCVLVHRGSETIATELQPRPRPLASVAHGPPAAL